MEWRRPRNCLPLPDLIEGTIVLKRLKPKFAMFAACIGVALIPGAAALAEDSAASKKPFDVKSNFRNICGFCHEDYGRHAGKGPQLMNSERSDQFLFERIKKGLPGRMAAFGSVYTDEQIWQIVKFIRNLRSGEEPQNPS
jgi:mono/diheme cytochrome c family protein